MSFVWDRFYLLTRRGPDLVLQDPILLQHFYVGLDKKSQEYLDTSSGGSFLHLRSYEARRVLDKILDNNFAKLLEEKHLLKEEPFIIAEDEHMPYSLIPTIKSTEVKEKLPTPNSDFMIDFDDDLFSEYGNTSKYHREKKPLRKKSFY